MLGSILPIYVYIHTYVYLYKYLYISLSCSLSLSIYVCTYICTYMIYMCDFNEHLDTACDTASVHCLKLLSTVLPVNV